MLKYLYWNADSHDLSILEFEQADGSLQTNEILVSFDSFFFFHCLSMMNCIIIHDPSMNVFSAAGRLKCDTPEVSHPLWI